MLVNNAISKTYERYVLVDTEHGFDKGFLLFFSGLRLFSSVLKETASCYIVRLAPVTYCCFNTTSVTSS